MHYFLDFSTSIPVGLFPLLIWFGLHNFLLIIPILLRHFFDKYSYLGRLELFYLFRTTSIRKNTFLHIRACAVRITAIGCWEMEGDADNEGAV